MGKLLQPGNEKLDKSILCWSITPVASCPNHTACSKTCYARILQRWPVVKKTWAANFELAKSGALFDRISDQLRHTKKDRVRLHVAGDFFSQEYVDTWFKIARAFPEKLFFTYTKTFGIWDFSNKPKNMHIINSICPDGGLNYGDGARVKELKKQGYFVCPATGCGSTCTYCQHGKKVCFHVH